MKKCEYCAKEITYFEQYCSEDCEGKANEYYKLVENKTKLFGTINIICFIVLCIAFFWSVFQSSIGIYILGGVLMVMGLLYFLLPFGPENIKDKLKIQKMVKFVKILGISFIVIGLVIGVVATIVFNM